MLVTFYFMGQWLFEARSIMFMVLIGLGLGTLHPALIYGLSSLANMQMPLKPLVMEGVIQAMAFPIIWLVADNLFPKRLRLDVRPL